MKVEPRRPLAIVYPRGLLVQVGTMYPDHGPDRDSPLEVYIGPGV